MWIGELTGQGWPQIGELALAFVLSALIGVEREIRHKSAGLRTYTLVGFAAALIMLVSKYGFTDILETNRIVLDPSRIAAQIVSGIGFIGGGLIFVRRDAVRGLTTAAIVWLTAAVGMACGAGLPILALFVTACHFVVILGFPVIVRRLPRSRWTPSRLQISYEDGRGILRDILIVCTHHGFAVSRMHVEREGLLDDNLLPAAPEGDEIETIDELDEKSDASVPETSRSAPKRIVTVVLEVQGVRSIPKLASRLADISGVVAVGAGDVNAAAD